MNIPHVIHFRANMLIKKEKIKKHIKEFSKIHFREDNPEKHVKKVSKLELEKGDPDFVDERTSCDLPKKKETFLSSLFE